MASQTTTGSAPGSVAVGNTDSSLSQAFGQQATISGGQANTTFAAGVQPPLANFQKHHGPGHCYHHGPHKNRSLFDVQTAYQKHHGISSQQPGVAAATAKGDQDVQATAEQYKAAKAEEQAELVKFEEVRSHVNALINSQDWNQMESSHVHELGTKLRDLERRFWDLKPSAERLVLKGRNKLAERLDLAEEELQHAIVVVSQIYRNRVKAAAHAKYPGKRHPRDRGFIGHGHPGHFGASSQGGYNVQPYHGHPSQGYGGYY